MLVKRVRKMSGHHEETAAETPMDTLHVQGSTKGPASWNGEFREVDLVDLSQFVQESLLVLHNLEDAVVQPDQGGVVCVLEGLMDKLHLGVHQRIELLRVLLWVTMGG